MGELKKRIKTYAFVHQCDLDEATYKVLLEIVNECRDERSTEGLFDKLSGVETEGKDGR